jgi:hypothetical protein
MLIMNWFAVLRGWLIVGVLDISENFIFYGLRGIAPSRILKAGIAGAILGRENAMKGGWEIAALGMAMHFFVAFCVVLVYHLLASRYEVLRRRTVLCGVAYAFCVFAVMYFVVMPLSQLGWPKFTVVGLSNSLFAHIFCVGLPAAWSARERRSAPALSPV